MVIALTSYENGKTFFINPEYIVLFIEGLNRKNDPVTYLSVVDRDDPLVVKETTDQIRNLIDPKYSL